MFVLDLGDEINYIADKTKIAKETVKLVIQGADFGCYMNGWQDVLSFDDSEKIYGCTADEWKKYYNSTMYNSYKYCQPMTEFISNKTGLDGELVDFLLNEDMDYVDRLSNPWKYETEVIQNAKTR